MQFQVLTYTKSTLQVILWKGNSQSMQPRKDVAIAYDQTISLQDIHVHSPSLKYCFLTSLRACHTDLTFAHILPFNKHSQENIDEKEECYCQGNTFKNLSNTFLLTDSQIHNHDYNVHNDKYNSKYSAKRKIQLER